VLHTLVAIDPDVPSRQNSRYSEFLHWLVVNIPGDDIERGKAAQKESGPKLLVSVTLANQFFSY
jgi:phosphatidylethanolamine-binding protein